MNIGLFSCFISKSNDFCLSVFFYVFFLPLFVFIWVFFICMFIVSSKTSFYLKKLRFLSPNFMNTSSFSYFISKNFNFHLQTSWIQVHFLALSQKVLIFASILIDVVFMCFIFTPHLLLRFLFYLYLYLYAFFFNFLFFIWIP